MTNWSRQTRFTEQRSVAVTCVDNGKTVTALVESYRSDAIRVRLPNDLVLNLRKHNSQVSTFVGSQGGLEFICKIP